MHTRTHGAPAVPQLSAYSILHPHSHNRVSTRVSLFALQGREKQGRPHLNISKRAKIRWAPSDATQASHHVSAYLCRVWRHRSGCWGSCPPELWGPRRWQGAWVGSCWRWWSSLREEEKAKAGSKKTRPHGSSGLSPPPTAQGTAPDVGAGIQFPC